MTLYTTEKQKTKNISTGKSYNLDLSKRKKLDILILTYLFVLSIIDKLTSSLCGIYLS